MGVTGKVIAVPYKVKDMWANLYGILISGGNIIDVVRVDHMTMQGNWHVEGDNYKDVMTDDMFLAKLYILSEDGEMHQLKFNQWKSAIKSKLINAESKVTYELLPSTFSEGYYLKICVFCGGHFNGAKKQQECEACSEKNRSAKIIDKEKTKRPRIIRKKNETTI